MDIKSLSSLLEKAKNAGSRVDVYTAQSVYLDLYIEDIQDNILVGKFDFWSYEDEEDIHGRLAGSREVWIPINQITTVERVLSHVPRNIEDIQVANKG